MQAHQQVQIQKILNAAHYSSCSLQRCGLLWSLTEVCRFHLFMPLLCFTPQTNMPINILNNAKCYCNNNKERGQYIRVITESLWQTRRRAGTHFLLPSAEGVKSIIRFGACILIRKDCVNGAGMLAAASCWLQYNPAPAAERAQDWLCHNTKTCHVFQLYLKYRL